MLVQSVTTAGPDSVVTSSFQRSFGLPPSRTEAVNEPKPMKSGFSRDWRTLHQKKTIPKKAASKGGDGSGSQEPRVEKFRGFDNKRVDAGSEIQLLVPLRSWATRKVGLRHLGEIEVNYNIHSLYVDTTSEQIGADQVPAQARSEVVEHPVPVGLLHAGVNVVAAVAQLGDLFRQQLDTLRRVAEDDRLIDLQLREERVQAVHLLALLHEGVVLRDTLQRQLLHQVDLVRIAQMLLHEVLHAQWECRREQEDLALLWQSHYDMIQHALEVLRQQLIGLV
uniref:Uncharacterized protein n=1 Tax=Anopheles atroparvus TaxID=41427 RepID=A0A182JGA4_ANOAO